MSRLDLTLDRPGRHDGALLIPWSRENSAYGQLVVPVHVLQGAPGRTALFFGGVHGDEYEGPIVLAELARTLDPGTLTGRVILVPRANPPAAGRRTSPVDGGNLARLFPGDPGGSLTAALAAGISTHLLPLADAVIDLHAGGSSLEYIPCAWGRLPADPAQSADVVDLLRAFAPLAAIVARPDGASTLVAQALAAGCIAIAAELGGGGTVTSASLRTAREGCRRALQHLGILPGPPATPGRLLTVHAQHFLRASQPGLFERAFTLGQAVGAGDVAGWLHDPGRPGPPATLHWPGAGLVLCGRVPAPCEPGDVLAHLAEPRA